MTTIGWRRLMFATTALALGLGGAVQAAPLPSGGAVASGSASIGTSGGVLTVNQTSAKAILTWNAFSIGAGNTVQFNNGSGATLNRVTGTGASQIDGSLLATGSVYLVNPNGVVVGKTGVVNTGGTFVASSLDISDSAFLAGGALTFSGTSAASVVNLGQVGSTGGDVVLAAQTVENDGAITAPAGDVGLLAGSQVTLSDTLASNGKFSVALGSSSSATNSGQITAALAELRAYGGNVYALAGNGGGAITAIGTTSGQGQVFLTAAAPSAATGVGDVTVGGGVTFSGGANALTIDAFHNAEILTKISTYRGHIALTVNDGGVGGDYSFGLGAGGFNGSLQFLGGAGSGETLTINGQAYSLIYSIDDLEAISYASAGHYALANDLDYTDAEDDFSSPYYQGGLAGPQAGSVFEGAGHTISDVTVLNGDPVGLFKTSSGLIRDLGVLNDKITGDAAGGLVGVNSGSVIASYSTGRVTQSSGNGYSAAGGLVGVNLGAISGSFSSVSVNGNQYLGGLAGMDLGTITGSYATGAVHGSIAVGGLVGFVGLVNGANSSGQRYITTGGVVTDSYATGSVTGASDAGGLAGDNTGAISASYASGVVSLPALSSTPSQIFDGGGLVGFNAGPATITNSYATGAITCNCASDIANLYSGGLVGINDGAVTTSYATGAVRSPAGGVSSPGVIAGAGGLIGAASITMSEFPSGPGTATHSYWDIDTTGQSGGAGGTGLTTAQFATASSFTGFSFTTTPGASGWVIVDQDGTLNNNLGFTAGATRPLLASEYSTTITTGHQLQLIAMNLGAVYTLANNVSLAEESSASGVWSSSEGFSPIGGLGGAVFSGSLNGQGFAIDGLTINTPFTMEHGGLFGVIRNRLAGAISVDDLSLTHVSITGGTNIGALAGRVFFSAIDDVSASGSVTGTVSVGGLIGYDDASPVTGSSASVTVEAARQVGGLIGWNSGALSEDSATGAVSGPSPADSMGGLVGTNYGAIDHSWASGAVVNLGTLIGGLVGDDAGAVTTSYATGQVGGYGDVGGLVGRVRGASLSDDYATGSVTGIGAGAYDLGGFAGVTDAASSITRVYATGQITGSVFTGGLVGYNSGALTDAYWDVQLTGLYNAVGGVPGAIDATGLHTAQMGRQASYVGWNFTTVWNAPAGGAPPTLR